MTDVKNKISYDETVDEALLQRFFADSTRMDIADEGFTDRLMRRLPEEVDARCYRLYRLWTTAMTAVCVAVFFLVAGFDLIKMRVCGAVGGFLNNMVDGLRERVVSFSFSSSADWAAMLHTPLMIAVTLLVVGSLLIYDFNEAA